MRKCIVHGENMFSKRCQMFPTFEGSISAVSMPILASRYSFCGIFQALQDLRTFAPLRTEKIPNTQVRNQKFKFQFQASQQFHCND